MRFFKYIGVIHFSTQFLDYKKGAKIAPLYIVIPDKNYPPVCYIRGGVNFISHLSYINLLFQYVSFSNYIFLNFHLLLRKELDSTLLNLSSARFRSHAFGLVAIKNVYFFCCIYRASGYSRKNILFLDYKKGG